jgi:hypothetical protein
LHEYCFGAGTLVVMASGVFKRIEEIRPGEMVLAVPEDDPTGAAVACQVDEVFHNEPAHLVNLHARDATGGELIVSVTPAHPFAAERRGWTPAGRLDLGDGLVSLDGRPVSVTDVFDNGDIAPTFNMRVRGCRTFFVAGSAEGPAVLVHNTSVKAQPGSGQSQTSSGQGSGWSDMFNAEKNGLNKALSSAVSWVGGLFNSGTTTKKQRQQAALQERNGLWESNVPRADEIHALPDLRSSYAKQQESQRTAALSATPEGQAQLAREAARVEGRQKTADRVTGMTPILNDVRDGYEVATGKDFVTGEQLSGRQRGQTAVMAALPGISGGEVRQADKALDAVKGGKRAAKEGAEAAAEPRVGTDVGEYGDVGGHHVHAKAGFKESMDYNPRKGFSIGQEYMESKGWRHDLMTSKQRELFDELAASGRPNTLAEHSRIAEEALVAGGATRAEARELVRESTRNLKGQGASAPSGIPWNQ